MYMRRRLGAMFLYRNCPAKLLPNSLAIDVPSYSALLLDLAGFPAIKMTPQPLNRPVSNDMEWQLGVYRGIECN